MRRKGVYSVFFFLFFRRLLTLSPAWPFVPPGSDCRVPASPALLHGNVINKKWEDAVRLCRLAKVWDWMRYCVEIKATEPYGQGRAVHYFFPNRPFWLAL